MEPERPQVGDILTARQVQRGWCEDQFEHVDVDREIPVVVAFVYRDGRIQARDRGGEGYKWTFDRFGQLRSSNVRGRVYLMRHTVNGRALFVGATAQDIGG